MPRTIDMTPTWGEWGNVYRRFAEGGAPVGALRPLRRDFARAMATCEALKQLRRAGLLSPEAEALADRTIADEMRKQGEAWGDAPAAPAG